MAKTVFLTFRYRIKDSTAKKRLSEMAISCNQVWNYCGSIQNDSRRLNRYWPSFVDLAKLVAGSTKKLGIHNDTLQGVVRQWCVSRDKIRKRPRWRVSFGKKRALGWVPFQCGRPLKINGDTVTLLGKTYRLWLSADLLRIENLPAPESPIPPIPTISASLWPKGLTQLIPIEDRL